MKEGGGGGDLSCVYCTHVLWITKILPFLSEGMCIHAPDIINILNMPSHAHETIVLLITLNLDRVEFPVWPLFCLQIHVQAVGEGGGAFKSCW